MQKALDKGNFVDYQIARDQAEQHKDKEVFFSLPAETADDAARSEELEALDKTKQELQSADSSNKAAEPKIYAPRTQVKFEELEIGTPVYRLYPKFAAGVIKKLEKDDIHISNGDDDFFIWGTHGEDANLTGWFHGRVQ